MKRILSYFLVVWHFVGLPVLGWWLASRLVENPPIVAPFLLASPMYAFSAGVCAWWLFRNRQLRELRKPTDNPQVDEIIARHPYLLKKFQNRFTIESLEDLGFKILPLNDWLWIDGKFWRSLSVGAREFALVDGALRSSSDATRKTVFQNIGFLAAYVLASINLLLIIPCHTFFVLGTLWLGQQRDPHASRIAKDLAVLKLTRDLPGAIQYVGVAGKDKEERQLRTDALREFAKANGI